MLHSRSRPRRSRSVAREVPREDPYSPTSANYAERHETRESEFIGLPGLVRVDIG